MTPGLPEPRVIAPLVEGLSAKRRRILGWMADDLKDTEIAERLEMDPDLLNRERANIFTVLTLGDVVPFQERQRIGSEAYKIYQEMVARNGGKLPDPPRPAQRVVRIVRRGAPERRPPVKKAREQEATVAEPRPAAIPAPEPELVGAVQAPSTEPAVVREQFFLPDPGLVGEDWITLSTADADYRPRLRDLLGEGYKVIGGMQMFPVDDPAKSVTFLYLAK